MGLQVVLANCAPVPSIQIQMFGIMNASVVEGGFARIVAAMKWVLTMSTFARIVNQLMILTVMIRLMQRPRHRLLDQLQVLRLRQTLNLKNARPVVKISNGMMLMTFAVLAVKNMMMAGQRPTPMNQKNAPTAVQYLVVHWKGAIPVNCSIGMEMVT